ncbi:hypothetical protein K458DRAFT_484514 [Lentithecium fluviatile CBS 122367]|uniref:Uncharacterized protein n=1 Tax=Lentithecium fluviatile CBS 122367 TaxID=1168545 RepID=A0A6G1JE98_9PLEO|nr:hypothetical protein K458DRAFT_484514 [Lentithecium fluviatile CBS 122367]
MGWFDSRGAKTSNARDFFVAVKSLPELIAQFENVYGDIQLLKQELPKLVVNARFAGALGAYYALLGTAGIVLQCIQIKQTGELIAGIGRIADAQEAMVALKVPIALAQNIYNKVHYEIKSRAKFSDGKNHAYFVFHPDISWHSWFWRLNEEKPLGNQFYSYSDDLPSLCIFMRFLWIYLSDDKRKNPEKYSRGEIVFHVIVPAYAPIRYDKPISFAKELHPLVLHGEVTGRRLLQLNLPDMKTENLDHVENLYVNPWFGCKWFEKKAVVLGEVPNTADRTARARLSPQRRRRRRNTMAL